jgi:transposase
VQDSFRQGKRGRPGAATRYRRSTRTRHSLTWATRDDMIAYDAASDGCFPLVTNDSVQRLPDKEVLVAYRYQPNLERRHHLLKSVQDADPVWLRDPARIEAIFCCQFLALLVGALIERQIRTAMRHADQKSIPIYPELRESQAPSAERIFNVFTHLTRHELRRDDELVQTFEAELTPQQQQILDLLGVPASAYSPN